MKNSRGWCKSRWNSRGGSTPKMEGKTWISRGVNAKKWKIPVTVNSFKKIDILNRGGGINKFEIRFENKFKEKKNETNWIYKC